MELVLPALYPAQYHAIYGHLVDASGKRLTRSDGSKLRPARIACIEGSTKCGKTAGMLVWQIDRLCRDTARGEHWWVAPVYGQARMAYRRATRMLRSVPGLRKHDSDLWIEMPNGARWSFKSAEKPDNIFGEDTRSAVIDEASRVREESWHAVRSTTTKTRGPIRCIGNVKGRGNWFYKLCRRAQAEQSEEIAYYKLTAYDAVAAGVLDAEEIESAKRDLPEAVFRELYLAEPADDAGNPFGYDQIARIVGPMSTGRPWVWGVDVAKQHDWTVCIALDRDGRVCRFHEWQHEPWDVTAERIADITEGVPGLIDSTGVGEACVDMLPASSLLERFTFTSSSKQELMGQLRSAISRQIVSIPNGKIRDELESFEYAYTRNSVRYEAAAGHHDDAVMALALAIRCGMSYGLGESKSTTPIVEMPSMRRSRIGSYA